MTDQQRRPRSQADEALEREIRQGRKFSLAEAIGRLAGPGMMKGESPATRKQQADAVIESYLNGHLLGGELCAVLFRQVRESELLLHNLDQPLVVLAACIQRILNTHYLLQELVRECDFEWGRVNGERPYFQKDGVEAHPEDPYTVASVRNKLSRLIDALNSGHS